MRGAYAIGAMTALESHFGLKRVDVATGSSACIGILAYYVAGQLIPGRAIWTDKVSTSNFLSLFNPLRGKPIVDIDFVIDFCFKEYVPLNQEKVKSSDTLFIVPLINCATGIIEYFTNRTDLDFFEILRASMAMPILSSKGIELNNAYYLDGGISDLLPLDLPEVVDSKKIIILTKSRDYRNPLYIKSISLFKNHIHPEIYRALKASHALYARRMSQVKELVNDGSAVLIQPSVQLYGLDNRRKSLEKSIQMGFDDAVSNKDLIELISSLRKSENSDFYFSSE